MLPFLPDISAHDVEREAMREAGELILRPILYRFDEYITSRLAKLISGNAALYNEQLGSLATYSDARYSERSCFMSSIRAHKSLGYTSTSA